MQKSKIIFLGLGSNLGDKKNHLKRALNLIATKIGSIEKTSSIYQTPPWGFDAKDDFYNMVVKVKTELEPFSVLKIIADIELEIGRIKEIALGYESRVIDLDILDFDGLILDEPNLLLPHAQMHLRKFVLVPLQEIEPTWQHPVFKQNCSGLLKRITTNDLIKKLTDTID